MKQQFKWNKETKCFVEVTKDKTDIEAPFVIQDSMPETDHPSNGVRVDSKSRFKRIMKAYGHEDRTGAARVADNKPSEEGFREADYMRDLAKSREQLRAGTAPLSEYEREKCKRINEQLRNIYGISFKC